VGSNPDEVPECFQFKYPFQPHHDPGIESVSKRTGARNLPGGKALLARKADKLTAIYEPIISSLYNFSHITLNKHKYI
jgi:hypothetical protein